MKPKPPKPKPNACAYCHGQGLSKVCKAYGWRVPIGEWLDVDLPPLRSWGDSLDIGIGDAGHVVW